MGNLIRCRNGHMFSRRRCGDICPYCHIDTSERKRREESFTEEELFESLWKISVKPVCAWLICIRGAQKGRDYRIVSGKNYIGRSDRMEIQILGDNEISEEDHAALSFDSREGEGTLLPSENGGMLYLNGRALYLPTALSAYDLIAIGGSEFLYLPFAGKNFSWEEEERAEGL